MEAKMFLQSVGMERQSVNVGDKVNQNGVLISSDRDVKAQKDAVYVFRNAIGTCNIVATHRLIASSISSKSTRKRDIDDRQAHAQWGDMKKRCEEN